MSQQWLILVAATLIVVVMNTTAQLPSSPTLGVCYYPEHWPQSQWESHITRMKEIGINYVRIGEFAWSVIEPSHNQFSWTLFDKVLDLFAKHQVNVIFGTPTATPPKWLIDKLGGGDDENSSILAFTKGNQVRTFGSRRHYKFSSDVYIEETRRIVEQIGNRYGKHPAIAGFQVDNEFGCHDTVRSYDRTSTLTKFRAWLQEKYHNDIKLLNAQWGNIFWSMIYNSFDEIDLPNLTVTEANPSHWLAFYRFSSDMVSVYGNIQVQILKKYVPEEKFITHNYMGMVFDMDHYDLTTRSPFDIASWDSYPLGFTDSFPIFSDQERIKYARTGHPDIATFHHDLYAGVTYGGMKRGSFIVIEQQPGPVNWAQHNPSPAPGMVRLWTWEAFAHGSNLVSYFRWKQAPFAQEQMHTGLNTPDDKPDVAYFEAKQVNDEIAKIVADAAFSQPTQKAPVALLFSYPSAWLFEIQPQGKEFSYNSLVYNFYTILRQFGLDVDILRPGADLTGYKVVVVPSLPMVNESSLVIPSFEKFVTGNNNVQLILGPRTGSKTKDLTFETPMPPGSQLQNKLLPITVNRVESFRPGSPVNEMVNYQGIDYELTVWKEWITVQEGAKLSTVASFTDDGKRPAVVRNEFDKSAVDYLAFWPNRDFLKPYLKDALTSRGISVADIPETIRVRTRGQLTFVFNYDSVTADVSSLLPKNYRVVLGNTDGTIKPNDILVYSSS